MLNQFKTPFFCICNAEVENMSICNVKTSNCCRYDGFYFFSPKHLRCKQKSSYLCKINLRIGYPGRIPRGQDYIDTTH